LTAATAELSRGLTKARRRVTTRDEPAPVLSIDPVLLAALLALVALGLVMVFSASSVAAQATRGDAGYFLKRQLVGAGIGLTSLIAAVNLGYRRIWKLVPLILFVAFVSLALVLVPGIGQVAGGARRWIRFAGFSYQPAEVAKFALALYLARALATKREKVRIFTVGFLPPCIVTCLLMLLVIVEPDFGTCLVLACLLCVMLFVAGARLSYLVGVAIVGVPIAYRLVVSSPYRMRRILAYLDPWSDRTGVGYQLAESLVGFGSGGVTGLGLGDSRQKLGFLPEAHTDFIFPIVGEELGLLGVALVIGLFAVILWRGFRAALRAPEPWGAYLAIALTTLIGLQAVVNMGVALGLLPTKGLTLPFVSYGGSSLVIMMTAAGLLLSVSGGRGGFFRMANESRAERKENSR
jgi:cell division protein FtsW